MISSHAHHRTVARRTGWRSGNAIIEMAVVFPVLLWLSMGMVEFGQFYYIRSAFVSAARDGCRKATLASSSVTNVATTINATLQQAITSTPGVDVRAGYPQNSWVTYYDISASSGLPSVVTDTATIPSGDGVEVKLSVVYDQVPNCFRPLNSVTGGNAGIKTGKLIQVQTMMIKE